MTRLRLTVCPLAALILMLAAGSFGASAADPVPCAPFEPVPARPGAAAPADLTPHDWHHGRITLTAAGNGWVAARLPLGDLIAPRTTGYFGLHHPGGQSGDGYVFIGLHIPGETPEQGLATIAPIALGQTDVAEPLTLQRGDASRGPPELLLLVGSMNAHSTTVHFGATMGPGDDLARTLSTRPDLGVAPDHAGCFGFAGSYFDMASTNGDLREHQAGAMSQVPTEVDALTGTPAATRLHLTGQGTVPAGGVAALTLLGNDAIGHQDWALSYALGAHRADSGGQNVRLGVTQQHESAYGLLDGWRPPQAAFMGNVEAGTPAFLEYQRALVGRATTAPVGAPGAPDLRSGTALTWGYASIDLEAAYGWRLLELRL